MTVVASPGTAWLPATTARLRLRPGDRPTWRDAAPCVDLWPSWRERAAERAVPVDVLVALCLEHSLITGVLERIGLSSPNDLLQAAAAKDALLPRLAPTPPLRQWLELLAGTQGGRGSDDELPELVIPERVAVQLESRTLSPHLCRIEHLEEAIACERVACARGLTLEAWALREALVSSL
jgi:hypothetical protein